MVDAGNEICRVFIDRNYDMFAVLLNELKKEERYDKFMIVTDSNIYPKCFDFLKKSMDKYNLNYEVTLIKPGEENKNIIQYEKLINSFSEANMTRKSLVIAFGGGVCTDISGFAAATYMRGIDYINLPTTLLAQVDASIGGKTGIDTSTHKNTIGAFKQPLFTYINTEVLKTLPKREMISGIGEVIKYSAIMDDDGKLMDYIMENSDRIINSDEEVLFQIIWNCSEFKAGIVKSDECEGGLRKILNFGHTFGHAIELLAGISHGEAVIYGMKMAFEYSLLKGYIKKEYADKFYATIRKFDIEDINIDSSYDEIEKLIKRDKKSSFGKNMFILPCGEYSVGQFEIDLNCNSDIKQTIEKNIYK